MSRNAAWMVGLLLILAVGAAAADVSCGDALTRLLPCQPFLVGSGSMTVACCDGAVALDHLVDSDQAALKSVCKCLKTAAVAMGVDPTRAQQIPQLCGITAPIPIDPNVDCDSI